MCDGYDYLDYDPTKINLLLKMIDDDNDCVSSEICWQGDPSQWEEANRVQEEYFNRSLYYREKFDDVRIIIMRYEPGDNFDWKYHQVKRK